MAGSDEGVIGVDRENIIKTFRTQIKYPHVIPEKGEAILNAVLIRVNPKNRQAQSIEPIRELIHIK
jgi:calcineurin-like phosphoesterase